MPGGGPGASVTEGEAARQQLALALEAGVVDENLINAFEKYKKVLNSQLASYLGGLDPDIKKNLMKDPAFGMLFKKALDPLPFGARPYKKLKDTGETIYKAPNGKLYFGY